MSDITTVENRPAWKVKQIERDINSQLEWQENEIAKHSKAICDRFRGIHSGKLWRYQYQSWEVYAMEKWNMSPAKAYRIIQASDAKATLLALCQDDSQATETISRLADSSLVEASKHKPAKVLKALKSLPVKPTAAQLKAKLGGEKFVEAKVITRCPHCNHEL
jgi:hypothetical protein